MMPIVPTPAAASTTHRRAEPAGPTTQHTRLQQLLLAFLANLVED